MLKMALNGDVLNCKMLIHIDIMRMSLQVFLQGHQDIPLNHISRWSGCHLLPLCQYGQDGAVRLALREASMRSNMKSRMVNPSIDDPP